MKKFSFKATVCGRTRVYNFEIPTNGDAVITNRFCPKEFLVPQGPMFNAITPQNGETIEEFKKDCETFVDCLNSNEFNYTGDKWKVYPSAMADFVVRHVNKYGRIFFNDLLIYEDIYYYFLLADGIAADNIKLNYPRSVEQYLINLPNLLLCSLTQMPLVTTPFAAIIRKLSRESERILGV